MKKYLLIIKSSDNLYYETWDSYESLLCKVSFIKNYDMKCIVKWFRIDNLPPQKFGLILLTLANFLKEAIHGK